MKQACLPTFYPLALKTKLALSCQVILKSGSNKSLETLEVIDNAYKYANYKKLKDVLLCEIKNDIRDFIQNEVKQRVSDCGR